MPACTCETPTPNEKGDFCTTCGGELNVKNNLETLKEEAREVNLLDFDKASGSRYINDQKLAELITHVYTQAIKDAMRALPEEVTIHSYMKSENTPENNAHNSYRNNAITNLKGLMPGE